MFVKRCLYVSCIYLIESIQRRNKRLLQGESVLFDIHSWFCWRRIKEEDELWLTFHITSWYDGNNITTMVNCLEKDLLKGPGSPNRLCMLVFCFETVPLLNAWCLLDVTFTGLFAHSIVSHWDLGCFHPQVNKCLYDFPSVQKSVQLALLLGWT